MYTMDMHIHTYFWIPVPLYSSSPSDVLIYLHEYTCMYIRICAIRVDLIIQNARCKICYNL